MSIQKESELKENQATHKSNCSLIIVNIVGFRNILLPELGLSDIDKKLKSKFNLEITIIVYEMCIIKSSLLNIEIGFFLALL